MSLQRIGGDRLQRVGEEVGWGRGGEVGVRVAERVAVAVPVTATRVAGGKGGSGGQGV